MLVQNITNRAQPIAGQVVAPGDTVTVTRFTLPVVDPMIWRVVTSDQPAVRTKRVRGSKLVETSSAPLRETR